jgi:hypothetical protein
MSIFVKNISIIKLSEIVPQELSNEWSIMSFDYLGSFIVCQPTLVAMDSQHSWCWLYFPKLPFSAFTAGTTLTRCLRHLLGIQMVSVPQSQKCQNQENKPTTWFSVSRPTWGIVSLRQTTDFTPGYIAERACREELLDLAGMKTSPTQQCRSMCRFRGEVGCHQWVRCQRQTIAACRPLSS